MLPQAFDGVEKLLAADSDELMLKDYNYCCNAIELKVDDAIPAEHMVKRIIPMYLNPLLVLMSALGGFGVSSPGANGVNNAGTTWFNGGDLAFDGVKLFVCSGMPDNDIVAAQKSNLFFGTGLMSDHNEVKLLDMADLDGSQNVRVVMRFTAGVQIGIGADIVYYT